MILAVGSLGGGTVDVVIGALLVVLIAQREIMRASGSPRLQARMPTIGVAVPALLIAFAVIAAARLASLVA